LRKEHAVKVYPAYSNFDAIQIHIVLVVLVIASSTSSLFFFEGKSVKKTLSIALLVAGLAIGGQAQTAAVNPTNAAVSSAKPNLSGTWKLNLEKSDFGDMQGPVSETDTLTLAGDDLKIAIASETEQGKLNYEYSLKTDGTDTPVPAGTMPAESPLQILSSKGEWQDSLLVVTQKITYGEYSLTTKATYTLSADGKTLTKALHVETDNGALDFRSVYEKI
jgi:hypothetical protein